MLDSRNHREDLLEWLLVFGKNPETADGYARTTVKMRTDRMDQFYRRVSSSAVRRVLCSLWDSAGIVTENERMSRYAIRHPDGTYMVRKEDRAAARRQLRHEDPETTMNYGQIPVRNRRHALDRMG